MVGAERPAHFCVAMTHAVLKITLLTLVTTIAALLLQPILWPPAPGLPSPTGVQLGLFIGLAVLGALTFGAGVSFLAFGWPVVHRAAAQTSVPAWLVYLAIGWSLVSWWPHNNLHLANGDNLSGLIAIEYAFHVSLYVTALIVAWFFIATLLRPSREIA
jgi:hypothetical protein